MVFETDAKSSITSHQPMDIAGATIDKAGHTLPSHQSTWVTRWMPTSCATAGAHNRSASIGVDEVPEPVNCFRVIGTKIIGIVDESLLKNIGIKRTHSKVFKYRQHPDEALRSMLSHRRECCNVADCRRGGHCPSLIPATTAGSEVAFRGFHSLGDTCTSKSTLKRMKTYSAENNTSFTMPTEDFAESMGICMTSINGMSSCPQGCPGLSKTTRSLFITEKKDTGPLREDNCRSAIVNKINGTVNGDLCHLLPFFDLGEQQGKLHPFSISIRGKRKVNLGDVRGASKDATKIQTSARTDATIIYSFEDNNFGKGLHSGACSTESTKAPAVELNLASPMDAASSREVGNTMLPDMNLEHPASPGTSNANILGKDECLIADPGDRWIKRLKLSASNSAWSRKSSSMAETLPPAKGSNSCSRVGRAPVVSDIIGDFSKKDAVKNLLLSRGWIRRWLCNRSILTKKEVVVCEPKCSKVAPGSLKKERFPSIEAMALMGRATTGFQQCVIHKKGPFTVWKTKSR